MNRRFLFPPLLFALLAAAAATAPADDAPGAVTLRTVAPLVYVGSPDGPERLLDPATEFALGDTVAVRTSGAGRARLTWPDGAACLLEPGTTAVAGAESLVVRRGETWLRFRKRNRVFRLLAPTVTLGIRGTAFRVEVDMDGGTVVDLVEGALAVETGGRVLTLEAGQSLRAPRDGAATVVELPADAASRLAALAHAFEDARVTVSPFASSSSEDDTTAATVAPPPEPGATEPSIPQD